MTFNELLLRGANVSVLVFVVSSMFGVGLRLTVRQIFTPLREARLVTLSLVANFVVMPIGAIGLSKLFGLDEPLSIGLLLCGVAAGAPFLIKLAEIGKGDMAFAVGLMVLLMVVTVGYMPIVLPMVLAGVYVDPMNIARSLILLMMIPLAIGLLLKARVESVAAWLSPIVGKISGVSMILVVSLTTAGHLRSVIGVLGSLAVVAAIVFTLLCAAVGWLLGGDKPETKGVLALGTAQRNTAAALVVAGQNFEDANVVVMITVVMIVSFITLMPLAGAIARRARVVPPGVPAASTR